MGFRKSVCSALLAVAVCCVPCAAGTIAPDLDRALTLAGPDEYVPVVVLMEAFPNPPELLQSVGRLNRRERRNHVVSKLQALADESQATVRADLAQDPSGVRRVRVLWGINGIALEATPRRVERLASLLGVRRVFHDFAVGRLEFSGPQADDESKEPRRGAGPSGGDTSGPNPDATVTGSVVSMGAPQVWDQLDYTGAGVLVAVIDTGIDRNHPDLADHIWTNLGEIPANGLDDDQNGYIDDTWGWDFCTGSNNPSGGAHGTQVAGQLAGDGTNGTLTGMAPDAELMALGIDCDTPSIGWEASDYAIAHGAHLISQSYSWWWTDQPDYEAFRRQTDTELAAGVLHVNSAGNDALMPIERPIPYNISTPANCPAPWTHPDQTTVGGLSSILAAGNINWNTDTIDVSSSIGPAAWEDIQANTDPAFPNTLPAEYLDYPYENGAQQGLIKPDLSAYGSGTTTTCPGTGYCGFSGTSSAAPHIAGTLALMLESNSEATPAELAEAIMTTAQHRGDPGKNNLYGTGLVQAFAAVTAIESGMRYLSHTIDDAAAGNGDGRLDPGERIQMQISVESRTDTDVDDLVAILSSSTPGIAIHDRFATFPVVPARGTATGNAPDFSLSIDPSACATVAVFQLEFRYGGNTRRSTFQIRVGDEQPLTLLADDFETDQGWDSDPGATTRGAWVREDPIGVNGQGQLSNPEDDTSVNGVTCWVTGNGTLFGQLGENNNDVDNGSTTLTSPPFGALPMLSMMLTYDRWYYDNSSGGDSFRSEVSNDGGQNWVLLETLVSPTGGWETAQFDLFALLLPTDDMRLRFVVTDGASDSAVEGAVDEVRIDGNWVECQEFTEPVAQLPNPVGNSLRLDANPSPYTALGWNAPPIDGAHDAATLYRIERSVTADGPFAEIGSATGTSWIELDTPPPGATFFYRTYAENAAGSE